MATDQRAALASIKRFDQLIAYLRDEMGWPIARDSFEDVDDLFYDFTADELGIDPKTAAKIDSIKRLRPLSPRQPWGIFFVKFEPKKLPVVALRRILSQVALKKRSSANNADRTAWAADDLLFLSNYGEGDERQISFAHFSQPDSAHDLPTLKVLGWNNQNTALHLDAVASDLTKRLAWPDNDRDVEAWRKSWRSAFTLRHRETVTTSKQLSIGLAVLAGDIRDRIKAALAIETDRGPLTRLLNAFKTGLVHDLDTDGFADMYAQTIAYGLLSARISNPHKKTADDFASHMRTSPFLRELMETFLKVGGRKGKAGGAGIDFDELGVSEVVDLLDNANLEAVVRDFGDRNQHEDPVIHFYELFLSEYNNQLKIRRGVFYTPQPVVSYIVHNVHTLLQSEFGLSDGLADVTTWGEMVNRFPSLKLPMLTDGPGEMHTVSPDEPFVKILDPATGTATFLVEIIEVIHRTLVAKWGGQRMTSAQQRDAWNDYVPKHLLPRLHAFELMMAPYAIAHMKIGLKLEETGFTAWDKLGDADRVHIYLTDSLEPHQDFSRHLALDVPALAHEAKAVNRVKSNVIFTVIVGNPPYLREKERGPGERPDRIGGWVRFGDPTIARPPLFDDFVKSLADTNQGVHAKLAYELSVMFWRMVLWMAFERRDTPAIIGMISPRAYIASPGHTGMRKWIKAHAKEFWVTDLGGDNRGARRSENIFEIETGVAIGICTKGPQSRDTSCDVRYVEIEGTAEQKLAALRNAPPMDSFQWRLCLSGSDAFMPASVGRYADWPKLTDIFPWQHSGSQFKRLWPIGESRDVLKERWQHLIALPLSARSAAYVETRDRVIASPTPGAVAKKYTGIGAIQANAIAPRIIRYCYRALDRQWAFADERLADFIRPSLVATLSDKQVFAATLMSKQLGSGPAICVSSLLPDMDVFCNRGAKDVIPLWRDPDAIHPNLPVGLTEAMASILDLPVSPEQLFSYTTAILGSPTYAARFAKELATPGPRIPITDNAELFLRGALLGAKYIWLQTYGERWLSSTPNSMGTLTGSAKIARPISVEDAHYPREFSFNPTSRTLTVGDGIISGVSPEVFGYCQSGLKPVESWLRYRMKERGGRAGREKTRSELDTIRPRCWTFTQELLELLWVIEGCVGLWPTLHSFLEEVLDGNQIGAVRLPTPSETECNEPQRAPSLQQLNLI